MRNRIEAPTGAAPGARKVPIWLRLVLALLAGLLVGSALFALSMQHAMQRQQRVAEEPLTLTPPDLLFLAIIGYLLAVAIAGFWNPLERWKRSKR